MNDRSFDDMSPWGRELLISAQEGTFLLEIRNGAGDLPTDDIQRYRSELGKTLVELIREGLVVPLWWVWKESEPRGRIATETLVSMLASGEAWDPDHKEQVFFDTTDEGERVYFKKN